jgi:hypothetical protein
MYIQIHKHRCLAFAVTNGIGAGAMENVKALIVGSIYEKNTFTPNKLLQKVFQRILVLLGIVNDILKIPKNPSTGNVFFFQDGGQDGGQFLKIDISNLLFIVE